MSHIEIFLKKKKKKKRQKGRERYKNILEDVNRKKKIFRVDSFCFAGL